MEQSTLSKCLKTIIAGVWLCGLALYFVILPIFGMDMVLSYPEFENRFWPWLIFIWCTGLPCAAALVFAWRISTNIGADRSFSRENAKLLKWISTLAICDAAYFFLGNIVLLCLNMSHPGVAIVLLLVVFAAIAVAMAAAVLSHLVMKAALLQEQSDLTI